MIEKIISIGDLLNIKMCLTQKDYADITRRFTNLKVSTYYDFEIHYKRIAKLKSMEVGIRKKPFRNAIYLVKKNNDHVLAYSPKQEYSCENLIVRMKNKVEIFHCEDYESKILIRVITELLIRKLLEKGYFPIHASCVMKANKAILFMGPKNSGKSTALLTHVLLNKALPISNDITFVGKEKDKWYAFGLPYDLTFDEEVLMQLKKDAFCKNDSMNISKYGSEKIRFNVIEFITNFKTKWIWSAPILNVNIVKLSKNKNYTETLNITNELSLKALNYFGKDNNFSFDDYLNINNLFPEFKYEKFSKEVQFNKLEGNIIEYYSKEVDKNEKNSNRI